jgi:hypothetical protein
MTRYIMFTYVMNAQIRIYIRFIGDE